MFSLHPGRPGRSRCNRNDLARISPATGREASEIHPSPSGARSAGHRPLSLPSALITQISKSAAPPPSEDQDGARSSSALKGKRVILLVDGLDVGANVLDAVQHRELRSFHAPFGDRAMSLPSPRPYWPE
jgi:hypothetical protein